VALRGEIFLFNFNLPQAAREIFTTLLARDATQHFLYNLVVVDETSKLFGGDYGYDERALD
jgi:hypothetical protein